MTRQAFVNAITVINAIGGSTNAVSDLLTWVYALPILTMVQVLHILAMARSADVDLKIDDFQEIANRTPVLADLKCVLRVESWKLLLTWFVFAGHPAST